MNDLQRVAYSQALLSQSTNLRRIIAACPLAFGSGDIKERVRSVLAYHKPRKWVFIASAVLVTTLAICFMTNPEQNEDSAQITQLEQEIEQSEERIFHGNLNGNISEETRKEIIETVIMPEMLEVIKETRSKGQGD